MFLFVPNSVQQEMNEDTQKAVELMDSVEHQSLHLYHAEPMQDMPFIPPNTGLVQKSGYLYLRRYVQMCFSAELKFNICRRKKNRNNYYLEGYVTPSFCQKKSHVAIVNWGVKVWNKVQKIYSGFCICSYKK